MAWNWVYRPSRSLVWAILECQMLLTVRPASNSWSLGAIYVIFHQGVNHVIAILCLLVAYTVTYTPSDQPNADLTRIWTPNQHDQRGYNKTSISLEMISKTKPQTRVDIFANMTSEWSGSFHVSSFMEYSSDNISFNKVFLEIGSNFFNQ